MRPNTAHDVVRDHLQVLAPTLKRASEFIASATPEQLQLVIANVILTSQDDAPSDDQQMALLAALGLCIAFSNPSEMMRAVPEFKLDAVKTHTFSSLNAEARKKLVDLVRNKVMAMMPPDVVLVLACVSVQEIEENRAAEMNMACSIDRADAAAILFRKAADSMADIAREEKNPTGPTPHTGDGLEM